MAVMKARALRSAGAATLAVSVAATALGASGMAGADPSSSSCPPAVVIAVPGTWETSPSANPDTPVGMLKHITGPIQQKLGSSVKVLYTPYIADAFRKVAYGTSKASGTKALNAQLSQFASCSSTRIGVVGFSQGADVVGDAASSIGNGKGPVKPSQIAGVGLLSDPNRGTDGEITVGPQPKGANGIAGPRNQGMGQLAGRVATICQPADGKHTDDLYCGTDSKKDGLLSSLGSILSGGSTSPSSVNAATDQASGSTTSAPQSGTSDVNVTGDADPSSSSAGDTESPSSSGDGTSAADRTASMASSLTSGLSPDLLGNLGQTVQSLTKAGGGSQGSIDVAQLGQAASSLSQTLTPLLDIAQSTGTDPGLTKGLSTAKDGSPERAASSVLSAADKSNLSEAVGTANQISQTSSQLGDTTLPADNPQAQQLTSTTQGLSNQLTPLASTPADTLSTASSVLSVLKPQVLVDQVLNVVSGLGEFVGNLPKIIKDLQDLPPRIAALDIDGSHKLAGELNNLLNPLVKMAAKVDLKTASQVLAMIPDPSGYTQIAAMVVSILGNVDVIRLANDVGQAQEVAWAALKNPAALTGLVPIGLDLATVAVGMIDGTAQKTDPNLLGRSTEVSGQTAQVVDAAQSKDLGQLAGTLGGLAGTSGADSLMKLAEQGLDAASFLTSQSHTSYTSLTVDKYGRSATQWLADWLTKQLAGDSTGGRQ